MRLDALVAALDGIDVRRAGPPDDPEVLDVVQHTTAVRPGALFCCVPGTHVDGHEMAPAAVAAGATALLCERPVEIETAQLLVADVRRTLGPIASTFWGDPSAVLDVVGVTGTNGKTTVTHLLDAITRADGRSSAVVGTLSPKRASGVPTTPEATELQALLAAMVADGVQSVAVEVSSHALVGHRVDATRFRVAVFTNLGDDHLEFHGSREAYYEAKASLFRPELTDVAVVNVDDPAGARLAAETPIEVVPFSLADAGDLAIGAAGSRFTWRGTPMSIPLMGRFNVVNALAAATAADQLGIAPEVVAAGLSSVPGVPGRLEVVATDPVTVVVDYAHTPDALDASLRAVRESAHGARVLVVFGCGGDRDHAKRPHMGRIAAELADLVVVTSDNPRREDPDAVIDEIVEGIDRTDSLLVDVDRRRAIAMAIEHAEPGDTVLIAGKGHETEQVIGDRHVPFDDRVVARAVLAEAGG